MWPVRSRSYLRQADFRAGWLRVDGRLLRVNGSVSEARSDTSQDCRPFGRREPMTPQALLDRLVTLFPDFRAHWDDPGNGFRADDGTFTLHGVFAAYTSFFRERHASLPADRIATLGAFVSQCMASADADLDNAAATCFLENIAGEECDRELAPHFSGEARRYWQAWGGRPAPDAAPDP